MKVSDKGAAFSIHFEGFVDHWYLDPTGTATIGSGFTWGSAAFRTWWKANRPGEVFTRGVKITRAENRECFRFLMDEEYGAAVNKGIPANTPQHAFDAAADMLFNCGTGAKRWKWWGEFRNGRWGAAADRMRVTATTSKGVKLRGLIRRRKEAAELLALGDYKIGGVSEAIQPTNADDGLLHRGDRGRDVTELQIMMTRLGYYDGPEDGIFGRGTEAAVMQAQEHLRLGVDGVAGPVTMKRLKDEVTARLTPRKVAPLPQSVADLANKSDKSIFGSTETVTGGALTMGGVVALIKQLGQQGVDMFKDIAAFLPQWLITAIVIVTLLGLVYMLFRRRLAARMGRKTKEELEEWERSLSSPLSRSSPASHRLPGLSDTRQ